MKIPPPIPSTKRHEVPPRIALPPLPTLAAPGSHVRRVTLNLIRLSDACPPSLRHVLNTLADTYDWDVGKLDRVQNELIFGLVDDDLAARVKDEFAANLDTIVDHRAADAVCQLCGHMHIRFEFKLENRHEGSPMSGARSCMTGSTCIEEYGLNVQGAATAEEALLRLRAAITKAKERANREDWQAEHPDHESDMEGLRRALPRLQQVVTNQIPWAWWRHLPDGTKSTATKAISKLRAVLKYYAAKQFLTEARTAQVYASGGLIAKCAGLVDALAALDAESRVWTLLLGSHGHLCTSSQRHQLEHYAQRRYPLSSPHVEAGFARTIAALTQPSSAVVPVGAPAAFADDQTDLPV